MYTVFISVHAAAASVALVAAVGGRRPGWFAVYYWSLVVMLVFLVLAVGVDWADRDPSTRLIVVALTVLGGAMVAKAALAGRARQSRGPRFADHFGFTIVGLVDAFVVVTVFNLGVPGWLTAGLGAAIAGAGHIIIRIVRTRDDDTSRPPASTVVREGIDCRRLITRRDAATLGLDRHDLGRGSGGR